MKLADARKRMQVLETELRQIDDQMDQLVQEFKNTYQRPWVAHPAIHRSRREGGSVFRWRLRGFDGIGQSWLMFTSDMLQEALSREGVPLRTRLAWLKIERRGRILTFEHRRRNYERLRLKDLVAQIEALNALEDQWRGRGSHAE